MRIGKKLNLKNPKTFNEKLQWLKLHDRKMLQKRLEKNTSYLLWVYGIILMKLILTLCQISLY